LAYNLQECQKGENEGKTKAMFLTEGDKKNTPSDAKWKLGINDIIEFFFFFLQKLIRV
jgi:hypothetical protein